MSFNESPLGMNCPDCSGLLDLYSMEFLFLSDNVVEPTERFQCVNCRVHYVVRNGSLTKLILGNRALTVLDSVALTGAELIS